MSGPVFLPLSAHESRCLLASPLLPLAGYRSGLRSPFPAQPIRCSTFRFRSASLALPTTGPTLPSADFCDMVEVNRFTPSHESVTCRRSPEVSSTAFHAQPPNLQPVPFDGYGLRSHVPARPAPYASDPVLVHRLASLLRASFRPRLAASVI